MANPAPGFRSRPDHKILLDTGPDAVTVMLDGTLVAATAAAVILREDGYPARAYIPRGDVVATLHRSEKRTHCPYKGDATYFTVSADGNTLEDAAWSYEHPFDEMKPIEGHVAFDGRFQISIG